MLEELRIRGLGVIEESVLELGPGLTVVTGETGVGKTMLISALGLLLGGRADPGTVRSGLDSAKVDGVFVINEATAALGATVEASVEDGRVIVSRVVGSKGRSRAYYGGAMVPASLLSEAGATTVAVHGQSDQHRLLHNEAQRDAVDAYGGGELATLRSTWSTGYERLRVVEAELETLTRDERDRAREADLLRHGIAEIEEIDPQSGEAEQLARTEARLGAADSIRLHAQQAADLISGDGDQADAQTVVALARKELESLADLDTGAADLAKRAAELSYLLADLGADVSSYATGVETDPQRLAQISGRRQDLTSLTRKYGADIDEVLSWLGDAKQKLASHDNSGERIAELQRQSRRLRQELAVVGAELSQVRTSAAERLAQAVTEELAGLAMPHASISIEVSQVEAPGEGPDSLLNGEGSWVRSYAHGLDAVEIRFQANPGSPARSLRKGISGGELSRLMLGIEVVLAASHPVPCFVFDEVDAGVGGSAAVEIGRRLARLARHSQVLVVTHLPQVAAFADAHVVVKKSTDGSITSSNLAGLDEPGRVRELSRMLAGLESSDTALAHAEELLAMASREKQG